MDIPIEEKRNEIGKVTEIAPMANPPMYCPTKKVSTTIFSDMTINPIAAGNDCFNNNFGIGSVPKCEDFSEESAIGIKLNYFL
tara:strand:- start:1616 stop:1864 length:249 start_codon:yes stop_codon:yes gene_type:complete